MVAQLQDYLKQRPSASVNEIANDLRMDQETAHKMLDRLGRYGLAGQPAARQCAGGGCCGRCHKHAKTVLGQRRDL